VVHGWGVVLACVPTTMHMRLMQHDALTAAFGVDQAALLDWLGHARARIPAHRALRALPVWRAGIAAQRVQCATRLAHLVVADLATRTGGWGAGRLAGARAAAVGYAHEVSAGLAGLVLRVCRKGLVMNRAGWGRTAWE
jgi:hypothetical protein